ncbi:PDE4DIP isoform 42, partial [Pongo abelii]
MWRISTVRTKLSSDASLRSDSRRRSMFMSSWRIRSSFCRRLAKNEAARMAALVEAEKECNLELSEKLKGVTKNWEDVPG